jgi:thioesterase domain-containing protein
MPRMNDIENEKAWLEDVLTRQIPLGGAMGLRISRLDETGLEFHLPLEPNINDKGTAFGGALSSAMLLAGWSLPRLLLKRARLEGELVVSRCETRFIAPVSSDFRVICDWPTRPECERFIDDLRRQGRGRLALEPRVEANDEVTATLNARYAALQKSSGQQGAMRR